MLWNNRLIELISFLNSRAKDLFKICESLLSFIVTAIGQPQTDGCSLAWANCQFVISGSFRAPLLGINRLLIAVNHEVVDTVFHIGRTVPVAKEPLRIRLVFRKQQLRFAITVQPAFAEFGVVEIYSSRVGFAQAWSRYPILVP